MLEPAIPAREKQRVHALHEFDVVNTEPEKEYDDVVKLVSQICNIGTAHISLIDSEKQWIKAKVGFGVQNLDRRLAFCAHTILEDDLFIVKDASKDFRFVDHPMVVQDEGVRFYAGMPLTTSEGYNIGSLCVIDTVPRELDENQMTALRIISKQVIKQLELRKANKTLISQSRDLQEINEANQKLLFIIGHDVRSPLASLKGLLDLMMQGSISKIEFDHVLSLINNTLSSANTLLNDLLNWSAAQHEGEEQFIDIHAITESLISMNNVEFHRKKNTVINLIPKATFVDFDKNVLLFVLRNLVLNANKFTEGGTIAFECTKQPKSLLVHVKDTGQGMSQEQIKKLFNWEQRNSTPGTKGEKGAGLALLLSCDLLRKKTADLLVESKEGKGSTFSVLIPVNSNEKK